MKSYVRWKTCLTPSGEASMDEQDGYQGSVVVVNASFQRNPLTHGGLGGVGASHRSQKEFDVDIAITRD